METRLLIDGPLPGAWNMAVDELLLERSAAEGRAYLRFYQWSEPTVSLGYFQAYAEREGHAPSAQATLVRRTTGGGAIVHDDDLTYSLTVPTSMPLARDHQHLVEMVHRALIDALAELQVSADRCGEARAAVSKTAAAEPFLCFLRRSAADVLVAGQKIAGSAQRKHRGAILQHGSVLLGRSMAAPELPGIVDLTGRRVDAERLREAWQLRLGGFLAVEARETIPPSSVETIEKMSVEGLSSRRYCNPAWTRKR